MDATSHLQYAEPEGKSAAGSPMRVPCGDKQNRWVQLNLAAQHQMHCQSRDELGNNRSYTNEDISTATATRWDGCQADMMRARGRPAASDLRTAEFLAAESPRLRRTVRWRADARQAANRGVSGVPTSRSGRRVLMASKGNRVTTGLVTAELRATRFQFQKDNNHDDKTMKIPGPAIPLRIDATRRPCSQGRRKNYRRYQRCIDAS